METDKKVNGGVNRHTTHMCAKTASGEPLADSFWRAKRTARRQTFCEQSKFWEKKFDKRSERLVVFFFLPNWEEFSSEMSQISSRVGDEEFSPIFPVKKQSEMSKNKFINSEFLERTLFIPKKNFPCGAIAKKKPTQNIYII